MLLEIVGARKKLVLTPVCPWLLVFIWVWMSVMFQVWIIDQHRSTPMQGWSLLAMTHHVWAFFKVWTGFSFWHGIMPATLALLGWFFMEVIKGYIQLFGMCLIQEETSCQIFCFRLSSLLRGFHLEDKADFNRGGVDTILNLIHLVIIWFAKSFPYMFRYFVFLFNKFEYSILVLQIGLDCYYLHSFSQSMKILFAHISCELLPPSRLRWHIV